MSLRSDRERSHASIWSVSCAIRYGINDENGDVLAWAGRDPDYEAKNALWLKSGRKKQEPIKHRFPAKKMFRQGLELYGQSSDRLTENGYRDVIREIGILIVEHALQAV